MLFLNLGKKFFIERIPIKPDSKQRVKLQAHRAFPPDFFENTVSTPRTLNNSASEDQNYSSKKKFYLPIMPNNKAESSRGAKQLNKTSQNIPQMNLMTGLTYNPHVSLDQADSERSGKFIHITDQYIPGKEFETEPDLHEKSRFYNKENLSSHRNENSTNLKGFSPLMKARRMETNKLWLNQSGMEMGTKRDDSLPKLLTSPSNEEINFAKSQLNRSVLSSTRAENKLSNSRSSLLSLMAKNTLNTSYESKSPFTKGLYVPKIKSEPVPFTDNGSSSTFRNIIPKETSKLIKSASRDGLGTSRARRLIVQKPERGVKNKALDTFELDQDSTFVLPEKPQNSNLTIDVIAFDENSHLKSVTPRHIINPQPTNIFTNLAINSFLTSPKNPLSEQKETNPIIVAEDSNKIQILINIQKQEAFNFSFSEKFPISPEKKAMIDGNQTQKNKYQQNHHERVPTAEFVVSHDPKIPDSEVNKNTNFPRKKVLFKKRDSDKA